MAKQIEIGEDSNESFTQVDENRQMKNGVGVKMNQSDPVVFQKLPQEWMHRNAKAAANKIDEQHQIMLILRCRE